MCCNRCKYFPKKGQKGTIVKASIIDIYRSYDVIPTKVKTRISRDAVKSGKSSVMAHAGIKAAFTKRNGC